MALWADTDSISVNFEQWHHGPVENVWHSTPLMDFTPALHLMGNTSGYSQIHVFLSPDCRLRGLDDAPSGVDTGAPTHPVFFP